MTPLGVRMQLAIQRFLHGDTPRAISYGGVKVAPAAPSNGRSVTWDHVLDVIRGLDMLPRHDIHMLADRGIPIVIQPRASWQDAQSGRALIGGTYVIKRGTGPWVPKRIDLAAFASDEAGSTPRAYLHNVVRHEVGHAISTLHAQDRSEEAAEAYRMQTATPGLDQPSATAGNYHAPEMPMETELR